MSDIGINLDGVIAFLVAALFAILLAFAILILSIVSVIRARRKRQLFVQQRVFPHIIGMLLSLLSCLFVIALLLSNESKPPPRAAHIWLDHWLWVWSILVLALWPIGALAWKRWRGPSGIATATSPVPVDPRSS
jgi:hypothetical protein